MSLKRKRSKKYSEGLSCPKCHDYLTDLQRSRFSMRQQQILNAKKKEKNIFSKKNLTEKIIETKY